MLLNPPTACLVCNKEFAYRRNKTYCSNACKQKAYVAAKNGFSYTNEQTTDFSLSDYLTYKAEVDKHMPIIEFFFLRRHLPKQVTKDQIEEYIGGFCSHDFWENLSASAAYKRFQEEYLDNKYSVS